MNLAAAIDFYAYGTSEGVEKAWDTRGRGRKVADAKVMKKLGKAKSLESFPLPGPESTDHSWVAGFLNEDGKVLQGGTGTAMHDLVLSTRGVKEDDIPAFESRNNLIRFSAGDNFEYPLVDMKAPPTDGQIKAVSTIWKYVRNPANGWSRSGLEWSVADGRREESGKVMSDTDFAKMVRTVREFWR